MTSIGLLRKTDTEKKSDQKINVIVSYQPISVTVSASGKADFLTNIPAIAGSVKLMGKHPPQEAVILPHSSETFEKSVDRLQRGHFNHAKGRLLCDS
jgi:hypothetical protein